MFSPYDEMSPLDAWLLGQRIVESRFGDSSGEEPIPQEIRHLGKPFIYLFATALFDAEVANGGLDQFFSNPSGALAPVVHDALLAFGLRRYAAIMQEIITAFGPDFPDARWGRLLEDPEVKELIDKNADSIDTWGEEYLVARWKYVKKYRLPRRASCSNR